jgi:hypothetical protein
MADFGPDISIDRLAPAYLFMPGTREEIKPSLVNQKWRPSSKISLCITPNDESTYQSIFIASPDFADDVGRDEIAVPSQSKNDSGHARNSRSWHDLLNPKQATIQISKLEVQATTWNGAARVENRGPERSPWHLDEGVSILMGAVGLGGRSAELPRQISDPAPDGRQTTDPAPDGPPDIEARTFPGEPTSHNHDRNLKFCVPSYPVLEGGSLNSEVRTNRPDIVRRSLFNRADQLPEGARWTAILNGSKSVHIADDSDGISAEPKHQSITASNIALPVRQDQNQPTAGVREAEGVQPNCGAGTRLRSALRCGHSKLAYLQ